MAKNEAKIKFSAETSDFNNAIKRSNEEMSRLRAEMKLNETQMKATGATTEALETKHANLESQLKTSRDKTEALNQKVDKAVEIFGENSNEVIKLKTQLTNATTAEEKIRQAIDACNKEIEEQERASKEAESATGQLTGKIEKQQAELNDLKKEYVEASLKYGETSSEAKKLAKQIETLSGELQDSKKRFNDAEDASERLDKSFDDLSETSENTGNKMQLVAAGVVALGASVISVGKSAMDAFNEVDEGADNVIKATGATGETAKELEDTYKNVATQVVGSFDEIGSAVGEVNTRFGYTGKQLEEASIKFQKFSEITGVDSVSAVQAVSRALNDAGIPLNEYDALLDQLAKAGQAAGIDVMTLADSLSKNGSIMRSMGFDTQETIALLSQFEISGADASTMLTGMKKAMTNWTDAGKDGSAEFAKMVQGIQDGSVSASDAMDVFGTKAGPMLVDAIKAGKFEYEDMLSTIQDSKGTLESTFDGTIDGGYELDLATQNCTMALSEVGSVAGEVLTPVFQSMSETIIPAMVEGFGFMVEKISSAVGWMKEHQGVMIAVASVIGILTTAITAYNVVQGIKNAMDAAETTTVWGLVAAHWAQATAAMAAIAPYVLVVAAIAAVIAIIVLCIKYWDQIVAAIGNAWEWIKNTLGAAGEWINTNVIQPIANFFSGLWSSITGGLQAAWDWCVGIVSTVASWIYNTVIAPVTNFFTELWSGLKSGAQSVWSGIKNVFSAASNWFNSKVILPVKNLFSGIWDSLKNGASSAWSGIKSVFSHVANFFGNIFSSAWEKVKSVFSTGGKIFDGIKDGIVSAFKSVVNVIIKGINKVVAIPFDGLNGILNKISELDILGVKPFSWLTWRAPVPQIPMLAEGGILTKPTLNIAGEAGPEAIIPIEKLERFIMNPIEKFVSMINFQSLVAVIADLANRPNVFYINDKQVAIATAGANDSVNGMRNSLKNRGLVLD